MLEKIKHSDLISTVDIENLLTDLEFKKFELTLALVDKHTPGTFVKYNYRNADVLVVYLRESFIEIKLSSLYIITDIFLKDPYSDCPLVIKSMRTRKDALENYRSFLLLSICRESFCTSKDIDRGLKNYEKVNKETWYI